MSSTHLHIRAEVKPLEKRVAVSPENAKKLIDAGYKVSVERFPERAFADEDYEKVGCQMVETGSWKTADPSAFIVGLKELPEEDTPLTHRHIYFAHCYKGQTDWDKILGRFEAGHGTLLDLEFLVNDQGRRVAAFGRAAGLAGCAVGLMVWCQQQLHPGQPLPSLSPFPTVPNLGDHVAKSLAAVKEAKHGKTPKVMVMGAKGRCGQGAVQFLKMVGIEDASQWDMEETAKGGPFPEILDHDIFVNCIYLMGAIPPFLTPELIAKEGRQLSVIVDVSCDYTNPHNPLPIYHQSTSFVSPTIPIKTGEGHKELDLVAIDHLPSLIPRECSEDFSNDLLPSLLQIDQWANHREDSLVAVWERARKLYEDKLVELKNFREQKH